MSGLAETLAALGVGDEVLRQPDAPTPHDDAIGHAPFLFWLIRQLRPTRCVELGSRSPAAAFALCQAVQAEQLDCQVHIAGDWTDRRDASALLEQWRETHDRHYGAFSTLLADDDPVPGEADLLILHGDRAMACRAATVVAFAGKGEFRFPHAAGLAVSGVGAAALVALPDDGARAVRQFFAALGAAISLQSQVETQRRRARQAVAEHQADSAMLRARHATDLEGTRRGFDAWTARQQARERDEQARSERERIAAHRLLGHLQAELSQAQAARDSEAARVNVMLTSTSWRITAPLRGVVTALKRPPPAQTPAALQPQPPPEIIAEPPPATAAAPVEVFAPPLEPVTLPSLLPLQERRATAPVAVVLHVGHPEHLDAVLEALAAVAVPVDLFITLEEGISAHLLPLLPERQKLRGIQVFPPGGGLLPFLAIAATGVLFDYQVVGKLHTAPDWDAALVAPLATIVAQFGEDPDLGLVLPDDEVVQLEPAEAIAVRLGYPAPPPLVESPTQFWIRPFVLRDIVGLRLGPDEMTGLDFVFGLVCRSAGLLIETVSATLTRAARAPRPAPSTMPRVVAFYLPQFHPIPENDRWWGTGFTEWTNVTRAKPLFPHHRQPILPGELGFTDLRLPETRQAQADLAQAYGVSAFCYYHYWFGGGRRLLQRPLEEVVASGSPTVPFMVCWANESWSRRWDGADDEILMEQRYDPGWEAEFAADLAPILADPRYLRDAGGRPILLIYRVMQLPGGSLATLRRHLEAAGIGPVHIAVGNFSLGGDPPIPDEPSAIGADAFFEFPPHGFPVVLAPHGSKPATMTGHILDYAPTVDRTLHRMASEPDRPVHRSVMMGWDNTARRGAAAHVFRGASPCHFRRWLRAVVRQTQVAEPIQGGDRLVFVNAWNEWAEGTCLEPDRDYGRGWLEAVRSALGRG